MFEAREEILNVWNRVLEKTSEMLEIVKKRNVLLKSSSEKERAFRKEEVAFKDFLLKLKEFHENYADENTSSVIKVLEIAVKKSLQEKKNAVDEYLKKYQEAAKIEHEIEESKEYFSCLINNFSNIKLTKEEVFLDKMYEYVALILIANENDFKVTENNFFEDAEWFIKKIKESNDPVLHQLILDDKQTITYGNTLENFFDLL